MTRVQRRGRIGPCGWPLHYETFPSNVKILHHEEKNLQGTHSAPPKAATVTPYLRRCKPCQCITAGGDFPRAERAGRTGSFSAQFHRCSTEHCALHRNIWFPWVSALYWGRHILISICNSVAARGHPRWMGGTLWRSCQPKVGYFSIQEGPPPRHGITVVLLKEPQGVCLEFHFSWVDKSRDKRVPTRISFLLLCTTYSLSKMQPRRVVSTMVIFVATPNTAPRRSHGSQPPTPAGGVS